MGLLDHIAFLPIFKHSFCHARTEESDREHSRFCFMQVWLVT